MPEFEEMLAAVRADCAARPLLPAEDLRHLGTRRTHRRRMLATGTVTAAVTGVAVAAALLVPGHVASPPPINPGATPTTSATTGATTSTSQLAETPPTCQPSQLTPTPTVHTGAASGSIGLTVTITNQSPTACRLDNSVQLWHTEPGHAPALVPTTTGGNYVPVLAPGGQGTALIEWTDGYSGYQSSAPECTKPAHYHQLFLVDGGARFALPGITLDVLCGGVSASWEGP